MPFIHIRLADPSTAATRERLAAETVRLMSDILGKRADLTAVLVEPIASDASWTVGGVLAPAAADLRATITAGTNSPAEKAEFIAAAAAMLRGARGGATPIATYVTLDEVPAENWGYDGRTQGDRMTDRQSP